MFQFDDFIIQRVSNRRSVVPNMDVTAANTTHARPESLIVVPSSDVWPSLGC